jgi:hypothetical protein
VGDRGIVVEGGEVVRFYPWTSVASIEEANDDGVEDAGFRMGRAR